MQLNFEKIVGTKVLYVYESFREAILTGTLKPGQKLMSIKQLSTIYNVSKDTFEKAYKMLREAGYIISVPGKGNYVIEKKNNKLSVLVLCADQSEVAKSPLISAITGIARITVKKISEKSKTNTFSDDVVNYDSVIILLKFNNKQ